nr:DUF6037 family protein [Moraxella sp. CTOTU47724]
MVDSETTSSIRFNNLSLLLRNMKALKMTLETFSFRFNNVDSTVFLSHYDKNHENHKKHSSYIQNESTYFRAKLEFIDPADVNNKIVAYATLYRVSFINISEFAKFFKLGWMGDGQGIKGVLERFSENFENIPNSVNLKEKDENQKLLIAARYNPKNPKAIYCIGVKRNGLKKNGEPKVRRESNTEIAQQLYPKLFEIFCQHTNISFRFSSDKRKAKTNEEIIANFNAQR